MAGKAKERTTTTSGEASAGRPGGGVGVAERPQEPDEGRHEGRRSATVDLPFVTAQFHPPELRAPTKEDLDTAARKVRSMLPSGKSLLFYGGLAATAVAGVIEWPVAVAVGVGTALARQGSTNPAPGGGAGQPAGAGDEEQRG